MVHCNKRGSEAFAGHLSHIYKYEQGTNISLISLSFNHFNILSIALIKFKNSYIDFQLSNK